MDGLVECIITVKEEPEDEYEGENGKEVIRNFCLQGGEENLITENGLRDTSVDKSFPFVSCGKLEDTGSDNDNLSTKKVTLYNELTGIKEECVFENEDTSEFDVELVENESTETESQNFVGDIYTPDDLESGDRKDSHPGSKQVVSDKQVNIDKFKCNKCDKVFSTGSSLKRHLLNHNSNVRKYTCDICNKSFKRAYVLKDHKLAHSNAIKFYCDICNKPFAQRSGMTKHRHSHSGLKQHKCDKCNAYFTRKDGLLKHNKNTDCTSNVLKCQCTLCEEAFHRQDELTEHYSTFHAGEKKFNCDVCGRGFDHMRTFTDHKRLHDEIKRYICEVCNKAFAQRGVLNKHRRWVHGNIKNHVCDVCNKAFHVFSSLRQHQLTHSNERCFECPDCGKAFRRKTDLTRHQISHSDFKTHHCDMCSKSFKFRNGLVHHYSTIHKSFVSCNSEVKMFGN